MITLHEDYISFLPEDMDEKGVLSLTSIDCKINQLRLGHIRDKDENIKKGTYYVRRWELSHEQDELERIKLLNYHRSEEKLDLTFSYGCPFDFTINGTSRYPVCVLVSGPTAAAQVINESLGLSIFSEKEIRQLIPHKYQNIVLHICDLVYTHPWPKLDTMRFYNYTQIKERITAHDKIVYLKEKTNQLARLLKKHNMINDPEDTWVIGQKPTRDRRRKKRVPKDYFPDH
jgi:hypothetical protein